MTAMETARMLLGYLRAHQGELPSDAAIACELQCGEEDIADSLAFLQASNLIAITRQVEVLAA